MSEIRLDIKLYDQGNLESCPFCGHKEPEVIFTEFDWFKDQIIRNARIKCPECGGSTDYYRQRIEFNDKKGTITITELTDLIKAWNTRGGVSDGPD